MNQWTPEEDALLVSLWPEMGMRCYPQFPGRTLSAIRSRVTKNLKLHRDGRKRADVLAEGVVRIESHDDEPLKASRSDTRQAKACYGFIKTGPVSSVFHLASAIVGDQP